MRLLRCSSVQLVFQILKFTHATVEWVVVRFVIVPQKNLVRLFSDALNSAVGVLD